jgi:hypothetical protein
MNFKVPANTYDKKKLFSLPLSSKNGQHKARHGDSCLYTQDSGGWGRRTVSSRPTLCRVRQEDCGLASSISYIVTVPQKKRSGGGMERCLKFVGRANFQLMLSLHVRKHGDRPNSPCASPTECPIGGRVGATGGLLWASHSGDSPCWAYAMQVPQDREGLCVAESLPSRSKILLQRQLHTVWLSQVLTYRVSSSEGFFLVVVFWEFI